MADKGKSQENMLEKLFENDRQRAIALLFHKKGELRASDITKELGIPIEDARFKMGTLRENGVLEPAASKHYYQLTQLARDYIRDAKPAMLKKSELINKTPPFTRKETAQTEPVSEAPAENIAPPRENRRTVRLRLLPESMPEDRPQILYISASAGPEREIRKIMGDDMFRVSHVAYAADFDHIADNLRRPPNIIVINGEGVNLQKCSQFLRQFRLANNMPSIFMFGASEHANRMLDAGVDSYLTPDRLAQIAPQMAEALMDWQQSNRGFRGHD